MALFRGRGRIAQLLLTNLDTLPDKASFNFRFGRFVDIPIAPWPQGYQDLFIYGIMEVDEVAMWYRVLKQGAIVVDGGANFGYWSLVASKIVGKTGQVHAFEPVPSTCDSLKRNLQASKVDNVLVHQGALADHKGYASVNLVYDDPISGNASLGTLKDYQSKERIECKLVILDDMIDERPVRLIKLDIEGGELAALKGSVKILNRSVKPFITFEWNRATAAGFGYQPEAIQTFLGDFGYRLFLADQGGLISFQERTDVKQWSPMVWALKSINGS